jgi:hypothetical protein
MLEPFQDEESLTDMPTFRNVMDAERVAWTRILWTHPMEIEAYEKSEADLAIWLATYPRVNSVLGKLIPANGPAAEAIWKEMGDELMDAIADLKPRPTTAGTKVSEIAEKMLDRVTNAALTSVASSRTA